MKIEINYHLTEKGRRVDINFYQKGKTDNNTQIAFTKWMIPEIYNENYRHYLLC